MLRSAPVSGAATSTSSEVSGFLSVLGGAEAAAPEGATRYTHLGVHWPPRQVGKRASSHQSSPPNAEREPPVARCLRPSDACAVQRGRAHPGLVAFGGGAREMGRDEWPKDLGGRRSIWRAGRLASRRVIASGQGILPGIPNFRMCHSEEEPVRTARSTGRAKPPPTTCKSVAGRLHAICSGGAFVFSSYSLRILFVFSSYSAPVLPPSLRRSSGVSNAPLAGFDRSGLSGIQKELHVSATLAPRGCAWIGWLGGPGPALSWGSN